MLYLVLNNSKIYITYSIRVVCQNIDVKEMGTLLMVGVMLCVACFAGLWLVFNTHSAFSAC